MLRQTAVKTRWQNQLISATREVFRECCMASRMSATRKSACVRSYNPLGPRRCDIHLNWIPLRVGKQAL